MAHATLKIDLSHKIKPMKPMHGGGQPPLGGKGLTEFFHYVTEAGIPYSRLHDVGCVIPVKTGSRMRHFLLTFDRHNGSGYNWSYGNFYCFEAEE